MLATMKEAAVRTRAIPAPMLNARGPHTGGAATVPSPSDPWQRAQLTAKNLPPAAVSGFNALQRVSAGGGWYPTGTPRDRNARYDTMSRMSGPSVAMTLPFRLRRKHPLIRYSMVSTVPERERYCGYRPTTPPHDWGPRR